MKKIKYFSKEIFSQLLSILLILFIGLVIFFFINNFDKKKFDLIKPESTLNVRILIARPKNYITSINGYGTIKPNKSIVLSSEISGKIVFINPNLKVGNVIPASEVLFKLDEFQYTSNVCLAKLNISKHLSVIKKLQRELKIDICRINSLEKNKLITYFQFKRTKELFEEYKIGSKNELEKTEFYYNLARDNLDQLLRLMYLHSIKISNEKNSLNTAKIQLLKSKYFLEKCKIQNPFLSRVKNFYINEGEFLIFGKDAILLDNDNNLEIDTFLNLDDVENWIEFDFCSKKYIPTNKFNNIVHILSKIICKESNNFDILIGMLNRIQKFDTKTRSLKINLKIFTKKYNYKKINLFPILNGMFCEITIPSKVLKKVLKVPRSAVNSKNYIYVVDDKKCLQSFFVEIVKKEKNYIFIKNYNVFFKPIIITRLIDPLEGSSLKIEEIFKELVN